MRSIKNVLDIFLVAVARAHEFQDACYEIIQTVHAFLLTDAACTSSGNTMACDIVLAYLR